MRRCIAGIEELSIQVLSFYITAGDFNICLWQLARCVSGLGIRRILLILLKVWGHALIRRHHLWNFVDELITIDIIGVGRLR